MQMVIRPLLYSHSCPNLEMTESKLAIFLCNATASNSGDEFFIASNMIPKISKSGTKVRKLIFFGNLIDSHVCKLWITSQVECNVGGTSNHMGWVNSVWKLPTFEFASKFKIINSDVS